MQLKHLCASDFLGGRELSQVRTRYIIHCNMKIVGYTDDPQFGLGWCRAARELGLDAKMYDSETLYIQEEKEGE